MKTIIGYLGRQEETEALVRELREVGLPAEDVELLDRESAVHRLLNLHPARSLGNAFALGAAIGAAIYLVGALLAAWCQCNLLGFELIFGVEAFLGGILAGGFVGGVMGGIVGFAQLERDTHLYVQGVRAGGVVVVVRSDEGHRMRALAAMRGFRLQGVKELERAPGPV